MKVSIDADLRFYLFWCVCVPLRAAIAAAAFFKPEWVRWMSVPAVAIGLSFFWQFATQSPLEYSEDWEQWWNGLRPVHGALYLLFAYLAWKAPSSAWIPLAVDVSLGVVASLLYSPINN